MKKRTIERDARDEEIPSHFSEVKKVYLESKPQWTREIIQW